MSHTDEIFFTSVGCIDGRVQRVIAEFGRRKFGAKYPDTITEAGLVGNLAQKSVSTTLLDSLRFKIFDVSIGKHNSKGIIVHGHQECTGNPVEDKEHKDDIRKSVHAIKSLNSSSVPIVGVFVKRSPQNPSKWEIEEV